MAESGATPRELMRLAAGRLSQGDADGCVRLLEPLVEGGDTDQQILRLYGLASQQRGDHPAAIRTFRRRLALRDTDPEAHNDLGYALLASGEGRAAADHFRQALELRPDFSAARFNLARALKADFQAEAALAQILQVRRELPNNADVQIVTGDLYKALGRFDAAETAVRRAIALAPDNPVTWWSLINLKTVKLNDQELADLRHRFDHDRPLAGREYAEFALARAFEDRQDYARAWHHLQRGNAVKRRRSAWRRQSHRRWVQAIQTAASDLPPVSSPDERAGETPTDQAGRSPQPLFIVSLPRSGSTLTEEILASHSQVTGADELPFLPQVLTAESRRRRAEFGQWLGQASDERWAELGRQYLRLSRPHAGEGRWFCDKLPGNLVYTPAILRMLPAARIICVRRGAEDACVSAYRQLFVQGQDFSYDLEDLAAYYADFVGLADAWQARAPDRFHAVHYEDLVSRPEPTIRGLLAFCHLDWEADCLDFHQSKRPVATASAAQVRQPLHQGSVGAWRRYQPWLSPLLQALQAEGLRGDPDQAPGKRSDEGGG